MFVRSLENRKATGLMIFLFVAAISGYGLGQTADYNVSSMNLPKNPIISLNLKNADVTDVFRLIAEQNDLNIVVSPSVKGTISIRLSEVTLEEAMRVILDASSSRLERTENIIYIYGRDESEKKEEIKQEMLTEIFSINYINTEQLMELVSEFLSPDGKVKTFYRSKTKEATLSGKPPMLIVIDYPQNIDNIRKLVENLDKETPQVLIEAKIVETNMDNSDVFGTDWSTKINFAGSPIKLDTPYGVDGVINYGILSFDSFSAVWENIVDNKDNNILSNAKLTTLDNEKAHIHVGETIPVGITSLAAGGTSGIALGTTDINEWDVGITIDVTPHVLDKSVIMMKIAPEVSSIKSFTSLGGAGASNAPITSKRTVGTNILLRSGETIVIAGLVQNSETTRDSRVPVLSKLPVIGPAFKRKETTHSKTNLLIFITARIMELRSSPASSDSMDTVGKDNGGSNSSEKQQNSMDEFLEYK